LETQNQSYRKEAVSRLIDGVYRAECAISPSQPINLMKSKWRLATDCVVRKNNYDAYIQAIERLTLQNKLDQILSYS